MDCFERCNCDTLEQDFRLSRCLNVLLSLYQLEKQLDKDEFQEDRSMAAFWVINKQFQMFIDSQFTWDYDSQMTEKYFAEYTRIEVRQFRDSLIQHMESVLISSGHRFSRKKTSAVYEKTSPRSCLRWIPTGRIFKLAGLRWIPTGKMFIDSTTKVDSEPPNGSNEDITNPYGYNQTLNVSARTLILSAGLALQRQMASAGNTSGPAPKRKERCTLQCALSSKEEKSSCFRPFSSTFFIFSHARSIIKWIDYFNPPPCVVSPDPVVVAAPRPVDPAGSPLSTTIDQDVPSASTSPTNQEIQFQVTHQGVEEQIHGHQNAQFDNAPLLHNLPSDPSLEETTLQGVIPSNLHPLNQSFDTLTKLT
ncbi:hypothetical protein Tco_0873969 [Tanacetum coccineum]|uniref:Uncharacterized protein n=1 Tax=Tanacetum coccineum TaxID=301880 RepID=A0ABQ5BL27_9ASTR